MAFVTAKPLKIGNEKYRPEEISEDRAEEIATNRKRIVSLRKRKNLNDKGKRPTDYPGSNLRFDPDSWCWEVEVSGNKFEVYDEQTKSWMDRDIFHGLCYPEPNNPKAETSNPGERKPTLLQRLTKTVTGLFGA